MIIETSYVDYTGGAAAYADIYLDDHKTYLGLISSRDEIEWRIVFADHGRPAVRQRFYSFEDAYDRFVEIFKEDS